MKRVLLDTNVILDFLLRREQNYESAQMVINEIVVGNAQGYITSSMATDIFYLLQKTNGKTFALNSLTDLLIVLDVLTVYRDDVYSTLTSGWNDFEDALQAHVAIRSGMDAIVTGNIKDYEKAKNITIVLPHDFIHYLQRTKNE
ncbi:MAG: PIN domain-containing protein [Chitinophagaceae bacterium]|jgi:predicted nucleic acid-binding protein|nr:PIN domain-containing protein [Chitinophagaceae bacterium]